jgi:hypothetical protein
MSDGSGHSHRRTVVAVGRRLVILTLLVLAVGGLTRPDRSPATTPAPPTVEEVTAKLSAVKLVTADRDTVVRDGLAFGQNLLLPGTASWSIRLQATPKPGQIAAHTLVGSRPAQEFVAAGPQDVVVPLSTMGARQIARRKLSRLIVRTTFTDALGRRTTATSSVTVRR